MSLHFSELEWLIADEAAEQIRKERGVMSIDAVAQRIGQLNREALRGVKWRLRALQAERVLRDAGIEMLDARRKPSAPTEKQP